MVEPVKQSGPPKLAGALGFLLLALAFLALNFRAYASYFQADEMNNLSWTGLLPLTDYLKAALTPLFQVHNFRPVGHFYFREASYWFGLDFWKYVVVLHLFHLLNIWLVWRLTRELGAPPRAAAVGCILFGLHMALFGVFWKPMYVFDLLCGTFSLVSLLAYVRRHWIISFIAFWLAYKSKELAVMLPFVFLAYELLLGTRRWKPLIPFFAASVSFGLQALLLYPEHDSDYAFHFTRTALAKTSGFYLGRVFLVPYLGLLLPLAALLVRSRRAWFGIATIALFAVPLLFLPGRLFSAYCYVPFIGLAVAASGLAESAGAIPAIVCLLAFAPVDAHALATQRASTLRQAHAVRKWMEPVIQFAARKPQVSAVICDGFPDGFGLAGAEGALRYILHQWNLPVAGADDPEAAALLSSPNAVLLKWDPTQLTLKIQDGAPR